MQENKIENIIHMRKSIRKFSRTPLETKKIDEIITFREKLITLFPEIRFELKILSYSDIKGYVFVEAPHYLALFAERSLDSDLNTGFILEQFDLYFCTQGIGSCWLGMNRPYDNEYEGLPFSIMLAFGTASEPLYRTDISQYKRKTLQEISSKSQTSPYLTSVRLAPSAINKQPWYFSGDSRSIHAFSVRGKGFINLAENWRYVDLGISLYFLYRSATFQNKKCSFKKEDAIPSKSGCEYVISCRLD